MVRYAVPAGLNGKSCHFNEMLNPYCRITPKLILITIVYRSIGRDVRSRTDKVPCILLAEALSYYLKFTGEILCNVIPEAPQGLC